MQNRLRIKKIGSFGIVLLLVLTGGLAAARADAAAQPPLGDCNGDGAVTAADAAAALRSVSGVKPLEGAFFAAADATQSGTVDETDVRALEWAAAGRIPDMVKFVERVSTGLCREALFDRFCYTGAIDGGDGSYQSDGVSVTIERGEANRSVYFLADIYLQDVRFLRTAWHTNAAKGGFVQDYAAQNEAVVAVNGDYFTQRNHGPVVRNGEVLTGSVTRQADVCVLTRDGVLTCYDYRTLTDEAFSALPVYQSWVFGPRLLDDEGRAMTKFVSSVAPTNPRTVIGYYEPGHYCLLVVDGRQGGYSNGMTLTQLSVLCEQLQLAAAYNLDGGRSSAMAGSGGLISSPYAGGRHVSDVVMIVRTLDASAA